MKFFFIFLSSLFVIAACESNTHEHTSSAPKIEIDQSILKADEILKINIEDSSKSKISFINKIDIKNNDQPAGAPTITTASSPVICTPGKNGFKLPVKKKAIHRPKFAKRPEIIPAKEPKYRDFTSQCFSVYSNTTGLPNNNIYDLTEDKNGCLWIGTAQDGVIKYDGKNYYHFNKKSGIQDNEIMSLIEDRKGNMWFGGLKNGIAKYNGKKITTYTTKEGLCGNRIRSLLEDKKGNLWIATQQGLSKFDGEYFTNYSLDQGLSDLIIQSITEDSKGNLWFGTYQHGFMKFDGNSFYHYGPKQGFMASDVWEITEDKNGDFWIGTVPTGVFRFDQKTFYNYTSAQGLSSDNIISIKRDNHDNLWFGSFGNGITKYDYKNFTQYTEEQGLGNNTVFCLYIDKRDNIWAGTFHGGISRFAGSNFNHLSKKDGLLNNDIYSLYKDHENRIWISSKEGLTIFDQKSLFNYVLNNSPHSNAVFGICQNSKNEIWLSSISDGLFRLQGETLTQFSYSKYRTETTTKLLVDKNDRLILATNGTGLFIIDNKTATHYSKAGGLFSDKILDLSIDKSGAIWLATDKGLLKLVGDKVTRYSIKSGLRSNTLRCILIDKNNNIWLGSDYGITLFDGKKFITYNEKKGLVNNFVNSIIENKKGDIIITTSRGISEIKEKNIQKLLNNGTKREDHYLSQNFTYEDGLIGVGSISSDILEDEKGEIFFPSSGELTIYNQKRDIEQKERFPFVMEISNIRLHNENIPWSHIENKKIQEFKLKNGIEISNFQFDSIAPRNNIPINLTLPYNLNNITFDFIGIELNSPGKVKYKYILEGNDKKWSSLTSENDVNYGNLAPGQYTLKVKAINNEGIWSPVEKYTFTIRPPWWGTWWFRITAFIFMFFSVVYYVFYRESELKKKFRDEIDFLKNQINPHFLFNSLNNIMVMHRMQHKETENSIGNLSELLKYQLYDCSFEKVPLNKEIEHIENFMNLEKLRFFNLETKFTIIENDNRYNKLIEPLLLTMFIENAFKHSRKNSEKHYIHVQLIINKDSILFSVENSKSKEYKPSEIGGIGIKNVIRRLDLVYGKKYDLSISDNEESYRIDLNIKK